MNRTHAALSLAPVAIAARPCASAHLLGAEFAGFGVVAANANAWSTTPMSLKRTGHGDITARSRRSRRRPT